MMLLLTLLHFYTLSSITFSVSGASTHSRRNFIPRSGALSTTTTSYTSPAEYGTRLVTIISMGNPSEDIECIIDLNSGISVLPATSGGYPNGFPTDTRDQSLGTFTRQLTMYDEKDGTFSTTVMGKVYRKDISVIDRGEKLFGAGLVTAAAVLVVGALNEDHARVAALGLGPNQCQAEQLFRSTMKGGFYASIAMFGYHSSQLFNSGTTDTKMIKGILVDRVHTLKDGVYKKEINYLPVADETRANMKYWMLKGATLTVNTKDTFLSFGKARIDTSQVYIKVPALVLHEVYKRIPDASLYKLPNGRTIYIFPCHKDQKVSLSFLDAKKVPQSFALDPSDFNVGAVEGLVGMCRCAIQALESGELYTVLGTSFLASMYIVFHYDKKGLGDTIGLSEVIKLPRPTSFPTDVL